MKEYRVIITKTASVDVILQAEDDKELNDIIKESLKENNFNFDGSQIEYQISTQELYGKETKNE